MLLPLPLQPFYSEVNMHTQASSAPRLKNDTLGNAALTQLYDAYVTHDFEAFRQLCKETVERGGGGQATKDKIIAEMYKTSATKSTCLKRAQDFVLAGMGLGV